MTVDLFKIFREGSPADDGEPSEPSTRSAGAQAREGRTARQEPGRGPAEGKPSEFDKISLRLRRPIIEAVEQAVRDSPIEFGNAADFYRRAIEHELARRGLLKTYK